MLMSTYRLGYFTDTYYPQLNGLVTSVESFKESLGNRGHKVYIFAPKDKLLDREETDVFRFRSVAYPFYKEFKVSWPYSRQLKKLDELNINFFHLQTPFMLGGLGLFLAKTKKAPVILTYHSLWTEYVHYFPIPQQSAKNFAVWMSQKFCNQLDLVIVPSKTMQKEVESYQLNTEIITIPTGFSLNHLPETPVMSVRDKFEIPVGHRLLMFVGRIGHEKNIDLLIDAFKLVYDYDKHVHLIIVGQGPELENAIKRVNHYGLYQHVVFTGRLQRHEVLSMLKQADIFVFPSVSETQGLVVLEALASGLPTVAVNRMGSIDYLEDGKGGVLTEPTKEDFSRGIIELMNHPAIEQVKRDALEKAQQFTIEKVTDMLEAAYDRVYTTFHQQNS